MRTNNNNGMMYRTLCISAEEVSDGGAEDILLNMSSDVSFQSNLHTTIHAMQKIW